MIIIADSGSTKTRWALIYADGRTETIKTGGLNPYHLPEEQVDATIDSHVPPCLKELAEAIFFYGSGCTPQMEERMRHHLMPLCKDTSRIFVHSDLLGAARATLGSEPGTTCILGTGANSGLYDGHGFTANTPPLGYILGDEGSGAHLGKTFLNALYKGFLPDQLRQEFETWAQMDYADIIQRVYRQPEANRFLASLAPFIREHMTEDGVQQLVTEAFTAFFQRNIAPYGEAAKASPIGFVGSIAHHFAPQLRHAATAHGFHDVRITQDPLPGLIAFHQCEAMRNEQ